MYVEHGNIYIKFTKKKYKYFENAFDQYVKQFQTHSKLALIYRIVKFVYNCYKLIGKLQFILSIVTLLGNCHFVDISLCNSYDN